jgi:drug/metabolite transporter (DMT)-like permease
MTALLAPLLALASSVAWGGGDFAGGIAARQGHVLRVVSLSAPASLLTAVALLPLLGANWSTPTVVWGIASGLASAAAFALLYASLALGPMSVLSPITAVVSAAIPAVVGIVAGERLHLTALVGIPMTAVAIMLMSGVPATGIRRPTRFALLLAVGAGIAIGTQLVCLAQASPDSGVASVVAGRLATSFVLVGAAFVGREHLGPSYPRSGLSALAGALDSLANVAFLLAVRQGELAIIGVITALYPVTTVLLARQILKERLTVLQVAGLFVAICAVALLAQP